MKRILVSVILFLALGGSLALSKTPIQDNVKSAATVRPSILTTTTSTQPVEATPTPTPTPTPVPTPTPAPTVAPTPEPTSDGSDYRPTGNSIIGKVSYYSRAGCIGCSENLITASGEPLDDAKFTLAVVPGQYEMGQMVLVTNLSNSRQTLAKVNDTGGFAKYNRVADLSLALYDYLNAKTDQSIILIEPVTR